MNNMKRRPPRRKRGDYRPVIIRLDRLAEALVKARIQDYFILEDVFIRRLRR